MITERIDMKFLNRVPSNFCIYVKDKDDFSRVWALLSKVLKITHNSIERSYKHSSRNNYIKYNTLHDYIWSSTMRGSDNEYHNFTSLEEFLEAYPMGEEPPKATHDDVQMYMTLVKEMHDIDAEIELMDASRKEMLERLKVVKRKLNME